jgi:hypothetical protein
MHKSGLTRHIAQLGPTFQAGIDQAQAQARGQRKADVLGEREIRRLKEAVAVALNADRLRKEMTEQLAAQLSVEDEAQVLTWLSTDLGTRITRLEERSGEVDEVMQRQRKLEGPAASPPAARLELLTRLVKAVHSGESSANLIINMTIGIAYGVALVTPPFDTTGIDALKRKVEEQRAQIQAAVEQRSIVESGLVYEALTDAELESYLAFNESPSGRNYNAATLVALDRMLAKVSLDLGIELGKSKSAIQRKS